MDHNVQFHVGEVISVPESATYEYVAENQYESLLKYSYMKNTSYFVKMCPSAIIEFIFLY